MRLTLKEILKRDTPRNTFDNVMEHVAHIAGELAKRMDLYRKDAVVKDWPNNGYVQRLYESLKLYDSRYDELRRDMAGLNKMSKICELIDSETHVRSTPYTFDIRRCGII